MKIDIIYYNDMIIVYIDGMYYTSGGYHDNMSSWVEGFINRLNYKSKKPIHPNKYYAEYDEEPDSFDLYSIAEYLTLNEMLNELRKFCKIY